MAVEQVQVEDPDVVVVRDEAEPDPGDVVLGRAGFGGGAEEPERDGMRDRRLGADVGRRLLDPAGDRGLGGVGSGCAGGERGGGGHREKDAACVHGGGV